MSAEHILGGTIRKLWPAESEKFRDHLLRLDKANRRMRFAHAVSDGFIADYSGRYLDDGAIVYAYLDGDSVRACAELRKIGDSWGHTAEAAFSVETDYQEKGIATELLGRVIRSARNRGVRHLVMSCLADNSKMQAVARNHHSDLRFEAGEVIAEIVPAGANPMSIFAEAFEDRVGYLTAVFDLQGPATRAA